MDLVQEHADRRASLLAYPRLPDHVTDLQAISIWAWRSSQVNVDPPCNEFPIECRHNLKNRQNPDDTISMTRLNHLTPERGMIRTRQKPGGHRWFGAVLVWSGLTANLLAQDPSQRSDQSAMPPPLPVPASGVVPLPLPPPGTPGTLGGFAPRLPTPRQARNVLPLSNFVESAGVASANLEVKIGQGRFLTLKEDLVVPGKPAPFLAVGDPSVTDFYQVGPRQLRLIGKRLGTTDLSITTGSGQTYDFEVQVVADLDLLSAQLRQMFPDATLRLGQVREKLVVEGQARDAAQVSRIIATLEAAIRSIQQVQITGQVDNAQNTGRAGGADPSSSPPDPSNPNANPNPGLNPNPPGGSIPVAPPPPSVNTAPIAGGFGGGFGGVQSGGVGGGSVGPTSPGGIAANQIATNQTQVINLIRVPTSQQVMLKVRVAELNRTAFRQIGADFLAEIPGAQTLFGSQIGGNGFNGVLGSGAFPSPDVMLVPGDAFNRAYKKITIHPNSSALGLGSQATAFGTFGQGAFNTVLNALRRNNLLKILAEPNLVALNGHQAHFLAGGEYPVPSFSGVGSGAAGGGGGVSGTQFKEFGVRVSFLPILLDNDTIRLTVDPEVSSVDFSIATTLVPGGSPVPGLNKRSSHTTVELKQGETLAIAGLLQLEIDGATQRLPGLGDLPFIGEFFSNTSSNRIEKELVVTVTPYIVEPMAAGQVPPGPGDEVVQPNDLEFYLLNRIEGRTGIDNRATTRFDDPYGLIRRQLVEKKYLIGPSGYSR